jgi:hypothetical protein
VLVFVWKLGLIAAATYETYRLSQSFHQSLADMIEANICNLIESLNRLLWLRERARLQFRLAVSDSPTCYPLVSEEHDYPKIFVEVLEKMKGAAKDSSLPILRENVIWAEYQTEDGGINWHSLFQYTDQIYSALVMETGNLTFLRLEKPDYFSSVLDPERKKMFGEQVEAAFPSAIPEVIGACNCFALEQRTASVFHSMRVLEFPLVALAKQFNVPYDTTNWNSIIEGIESKVRGIDRSYGPDWKDAQKFFGDAARHFMFVKNVWRNHVMHVRDDYDEGKALSVLQHTKEFIIRLSERLSETP